MSYRQLVDTRRHYGGVYTTSFEDGLIVPWKPLSLGDYIQYDVDIQRKFIPPSVIEDEIFRKCVLDPRIVEDIHTYRAGLVSTVVQTIWQFSGPTSGPSFQEDIEQTRLLMAGGNSAILHQCSEIIATAFPYKPEEIYAMDYRTFLTRLVQAESKMLKVGLLKEPVSITQLDQEPQTKQAPKFANLNKPDIDAKRLWEQQQPKPVVQKPKSEPKAAGGKWWKVSPILEAKKKHNVNFGAETKMTEQFLLDSHEAREPEEMRRYLIDSKIGKVRDKMIKQAQDMYSDVIKQLESKKK